MCTYLNDSFVSLTSSQSNHILASVHQNAFSLHWFSFQSKVLGCVDDGTILFIQNMVKIFYNKEKMWVDLPEHL